MGIQFILNTLFYVASDGAKHGTVRFPISAQMWAYIIMSHQITSDYFLYSTTISFGKDIQEHS